MAEAAREVFARFGIVVDDTKLKDLNKKVDDSISGLRAVGVAMLGAFGVHAIAQFAEGLAEQGSQILDVSNRLGISTDAYQRLGYAAQVSGASVEAFSTAMLISQDKLAEAASGKEEAAKAFSDLGIKVKDAAGNIRPSEDVFLDAADAIAKMDNPAKQTQAAVNLFSKAGKELLPTLKLGSAGIRELAGDFGELGGGFDTAAVAASDDFGDALDRANVTITSMRGRIATALLPVLQKLVDWFTKVASWLLRVSKNSKLVQSSLLVLGTVLAGFAAKAAIAMVPVIAPFILWGTIIGGIILVLEDLYVWFKGGKSVIGEWLQSLLGVEKAHEILLKVRGVVQDIALFMHQVVEDLKAINDAFSDRSKSKEFQAYKKLMVQQGAHFLGGDDTSDKPKVTRRGGGMQVGDLGNLPDVISGDRTITARGGAAGGNSTSNSVNVVVNAGNADARETARLVRQQVKAEIERGNKVAGISVTREAPAQ